MVVVINSLKVPKIKKILLYELKFLVPNYSCLQNPWLGGYRPQIPVLSVLCPQLNLLNPSPPPNKIPGYATAVYQWKRDQFHSSLVIFFRDKVAHFTAADSWTDGCWRVLFSLISRAACKMLRSVCSYPEERSLLGRGGGADVRFVQSAFRWKWKLFGKG